MKLTWNGGRGVKVESRAEMVRELARLDPATVEFVVLQDGLHRFVQAGATGCGFVVELRDAVVGTHLRSVRADLTWGDVQSCLSDYLERRPSWEGRLEWVAALLEGKRAKGLGHIGKASLRRSAWIMVAFGLLALGGGALEQQRTADFLANARASPGRVVAVEARSHTTQSGRRSVSYDVKVRFLASDGVAYLAEGSLQHPPAPGDRFNVVYDGRDPARRPTIDPDIRYFNTTIVLAIPGALAVLIGAAMLLWSRRRVRG